ncbi:probably inactive leucine-rich repeat receptor-like protein kinase IMK2 [Vicia villosa]|uniref:probably inactive leucine-rich repeat receptor-like protein kinase IMK2 n=1 Tax=Vicia villosa TaxID=3911 RepID=UPI00273BD95E|nr:probably inactive leucine-rich repeat receptor-like protein kinase IMK2 [Vicia villosa]
MENNTKDLIFSRKNQKGSFSFTFLAFLVLLSSTIQPILGDLWDGVIVTQSDFQSLQAIKTELIDTKGVLKTWNDSGLGACSGNWVGIKCLKGEVIAIQLPWKSLSGRISEKIGQLQSLRKLSLHDNNLAGSIPFSLGFLPNLRGVYLFNNKLSGSVPPSIANLPMLQAFDVSHNLLIGRIPFGLTNSSRVFRVNLSYNKLSGPIPSEVGEFSRLRVLDLSNNEINGSLPLSFSNLTSLVSLNLENNRLDGEIPDSYAKLRNLSSFNVSHNNLSGHVPLVLSKRFNASSFEGNFGLCGYISSKPCRSSPPPQSPPPHNLPSQSPEESPSEKHHRKLSTKDIILIVAGVLLLILLLLCCFLLCCLVRKRASSSRKSGKVAKAAASARSLEKGGGGGEVASGGEAGGKLVHFDGPFVFTADDLLCATAEIMGKSAYGTAYKATLEDGNQVAVKRLREKTTKGHKEFEGEVALLGKIRHPNLLALRAYYLGPKGEKLLVFDYMSRGSLASFLHARGPEIIVEWPTRMKIAIGITNGLSCLHNQENIVHGNLTSSNILLDEQTNPHITDFGLSRLMTTSANTNIIATAGSLGYNAPELSKTKKPTTKTDVYSLGVILLELLTGKPPGEPTNGMDLPQWVASIVKEEWTNEVFDLELMRDAPAIGDELLNTLKLALHCVDPSPSARPEVKQVLQQLEEIKPELVEVEVDEDGAKVQTNE